jgi:predicted membrane protein
MQGRNDSMMLSDVIGLTGVACVLSAFFLLQIEKVRSDGLGYLLLNLCGALLLLVSLMMTFNLASFVIEICWLSISLFGLAKWVIRRRKARSDA